jgi:hypothetical protein
MILLITEQQLKKITEGVGDKYLEKNFGFKPEFAEFEKKYNEQQILETPISYIKNVPIYKNPKSLNLFDANVRAIADNEGNLYVALHDGDFYHGMMGYTIGLVNTYTKIYSSLDNFILLHRVRNTNSFGLSDSNIKEIWKYEPKYLEIINKIKSKLPKYKIHLRYFEHVNDV